MNSCPCMWHWAPNLESPDLESPRVSYICHNARAELLRAVRVAPLNSEVMLKQRRRSAGGAGVAPAATAGAEAKGQEKPDDDHHGQD